MLWFVLISNSLHMQLQVLVTVYTTTSAIDVFRPRYRMECAWELDTPLYELLLLHTYVIYVSNSKTAMQGRIIFKGGNHSCLFELAHHFI